MKIKIEKVDHEQHLIIVEYIDEEDDEIRLRVAIGFPDDTLPDENAFIKYVTRHAPHLQFTQMKDRKAKKASGAYDYLDVYNDKEYDCPIVDYEPEVY